MLLQTQTIIALDSLPFSSQNENHSHLWYILAKAGRGRKRFVADLCQRTLKWTNRK
jgi:hypothetical protein